MGDLIVFVVLLIVTYTTGSLIEKSHFKGLKKREKALVTMPVVTCKTVEISEPIGSVYFVTGCCVVGQDYFKMVLAGLKSIFGGRLGSYESLLDRGRREAILRMKEAAAKAGCHAIYNMRLESTTIGGQAGKQATGCIEVIAYGTAVKYLK